MTSLLHVVRITASHVFVEPVNHICRAASHAPPPGLTDWRNTVIEEADALMHSSVQVALS
jgi:hypothetical protein